MDYTKFTDDSFEAKEWINTAFRAHKEGSKDQYATTLVMKLQMFIQEVNTVIEETCQQAVNNLPRVMRELDAVKHEAILLQEQMKAVKSDIERVEHDTSQSMQMLLQIDSIKSRMQDASSALQEADNWTTLSEDVEEVFQSGDVTAISEKLVGMQQSLLMLTDVPDYSERYEYLETLKNRLEALLSPQVVSAFSTQSLESAQQYVAIFRDIDRLPQLYKYYHRCHKTQLVIYWRSIQEDNADGTLVQWLVAMYDQLLTTYHEQVKWCSQVFQDPVPIVCQLLTEVLTSLDPSIPACIASYLQGVENPLITLIAIKEAAERFAKSMETEVETCTTGSLSIEKLASSIYSPLKPYIAQYVTFEEAILTSALNNIPLDHEEVLDTVSLLSESVCQLFDAANQANSRCVQFTHGCGYVGLIKALQEYLGNYLTEFHRVLTNLREKCHIDSSSMDHEDWSLFQSSLRIIHTCGDLILRTEELDRSLVSEIVTTVSPYCPPTPTHESHHVKLDTKNPFQDFKCLLLSNETEKRALEHLITSLEEGDDPTVLDEVNRSICALSERVHKFAFDIVFAPLQLQLKQVPEMEIWTSKSAGDAITADLPTFSLSPQEYITKIGQYLMTMPQQLEPFTLEDNPTLITAIMHGKLPYTNEQTEPPEHLADLWLESIASGTMHNYCQQILKIPELSNNGTKQIITDIEYLCNVLDDLGLQSSEPLKNIDNLLKAPQAEFSDVADTMPQRLSSAIASMRNLSLD